MTVAARPAHMNKPILLAAVLALAVAGCGSTEVVRPRSSAAAAKRRPVTTPAPSVAQERRAAAALEAKVKAEGEAKYPEDIITVSCVHSNEFVGGLASCRWTAHPREATPDRRATSEAAQARTEAETAREEAQQAKEEICVEGETPATSQCRR